MSAAIVDRRHDRGGLRHLLVPIHLWRFAKKVYDAVAKRTYFGAIEDALLSAWTKMKVASRYAF